MSIPIQHIISILKKYNINIDTKARKKRLIDAIHKSENKHAIQELNKLLPTTCRSKCYFDLLPDELIIYICEFIIYDNLKQFWCLNIVNHRFKQICDELLNNKYLKLKLNNFKLMYILQQEEDDTNSNCSKYDTE